MWIPVLVPVLEEASGTVAWFFSVMNENEMQCFGIMVKWRELREPFIQVHECVCLRFIAARGISKIWRKSIKLRGKSRERDGDFNQVTLTIYSRDEFIINMRKMLRERDGWNLTSIREMLQPANCSNGELWGFEVATPAPNSRFDQRFEASSSHLHRYSSIQRKIWLSNFRLHPRHCAAIFSCI